MGSEKDCFDNDGISVVVKDENGEYVIPTFDNVKSGRYPYDLVREEVRLFMRGYKFIRFIEFFVFFVALILFGCGISENDFSLAIGFGIIGCIIEAMLSVVKVSLKEAVDSESERYEEIAHYRELSQRLVIQHRKERANG